MSDKICTLVGIGPGLGMAIAKKFGSEGYQIAMIARRSDAIDQYKNILNEQEIKAQGFSADASNTESLVNAFEKIQQTIGKSEVLIYNAAALKQGYPMSITAEDLVQDFKVNVAGALTCVQQVTPYMKEQKQGTILLTGGGFGLDPYPQFASLSVGKAAIRNLCFSLAKELEPDGIHVATVTICGVIKPNTQFDPDLIAQAYWKLHNQKQETWEREYMYQ